MSVLALLPVIGAACVSLAAAVWLFVFRRRFGRQPVTRPACRACRHEIEQRRERCPECGADLAGRSLVDANWPRRRAWIVRGIAFLALILPIPLVSAAPLERWLPWRVDTTAVVTIGIADAAGIVRPVIRRARRSTQFLAPGAVNPPRTTAAPVPAAAPAAPKPPPPAPRRTDSWALPIDASADFVPAGDRDRGRLARDPIGPDFRRIRAMASDAAPSNAEAAALAERCLEDPSVGSFAAGRTRSIRTSAGMRDSTSGRRTIDSLRVFEWRFAPLPPGTVVPLEITSVTVKQTLAPRPARLHRAAMVAIGLAAAWTIVVARRFRRVSPDAAFGDRSA